MLGRYCICIQIICIFVFLLYFMKIAIIGCGDVGRCYAHALNAAGHSLLHFCDSRPGPAAEALAQEMGAAMHPEPGPWLAEADLVISAVFGAVALEVAQQALVFMHADAIYADFTTASPADLRAAQEIAAALNVGFVDVAIIGAIGISGARTPLLAAGPVAQQIVGLMQSLGASINVVGDEAGQAIALKLLRSVFTKGLEALAVECLMSAEQRGLREQLYEVLSDFDRTPIRALLESVVTTHVRHAGRRKTEVEEARSQLVSEGVMPLAINGVADLFSRTAAAIEKNPLEGEANIVNSLHWLFTEQHVKA